MRVLYRLANKYMRLGLFLVMTCGVSYCQNGSSAGMSVNVEVPSSGVFDGLISLLWLNATPQAKVINGIILLILVYCLIAVAINAVRLKYDRRALDNAKNNLGIFNNSDVMNLIELEGVAQVGSTKVPITSTVAKRLQAVWRMMEKHPERAALSLAGNEELREETRADVPAYFSTVFVLMGLFGTIWGLSDAIAPLGKALSQMASGGPLTDIGAQVNNVTTSLSTAFSCTMMGVLSTIILSATNFFAVSRKQTKFLADLELFIDSEIVPRFTHRSAKQSLGDIAKDTKTVIKDLTAILGKAQKAIQDIASSTDQLRNGLHKELEEVGKQISDAARSLAEVGGQLADSVKTFDGQQNQFRTFVQGTTANLRSEILNIHQEALGTLKNIGTEHKAFLDQAQQEYARFYSATDQECNELGKSAAALQTISVYFQSIMNEDGGKDGYKQILDDQMEGIGEMRRHLGHLVRISAESLQQMRQPRNGHVRETDGIA